MRCAWLVGVVFVVGSVVQAQEVLPPLRVPGVAQNKDRLSDQYNQETLPPLRVPLSSEAPQPVQANSKQAEAPVSPAPSGSEAAAAPRVSLSNAGPGASRAYLWTGIEYLQWWTKDGPLSTPLLTTGTGLLGAPGTTVLFGGPIDYGAFSGGRAFLGGWWDDNHTVGFEGSGFLLERRADRFQAGGNDAGSPMLAFPVRTPDGAEDLFEVSRPGRFRGALAISSSSRLLGADVNGLWNLCRSNRLALDLLAGFRFLDLHEDLEIDAFSAFIGSDNALLGYDSFSTRNQFYGGQLGGRLGWSSGRWSARLSGLLALGSTQQAIHINGGTNVFGVNATRPGQFPGFVYTQPTNIGSYHHSDFSLVPQAQLKLGYDVWRSLRLTVAYDYLYWTNVARPGLQIDRTVNISQTPPDAFGGNNRLVGAARPAPLANTSDFWVQGVGVGLEFRW